AARAALQVAKSRGAMTVLNPAPLEIDPASIDYWPLVDVLIPNLVEAQGITGLSPSDPRDLLAPLLATGAGAVCVTLGDQGAIFASSHEPLIHEPAIPVEVVDTTGASDSFCAAFALAVAERQPIKRALKFATA